MGSNYSCKGNGNYGDRKLTDMNGRNVVKKWQQ